MNRKDILSFFVLLLFWNAPHLQAQTVQKEKQTLVSILKQLETKYSISFSYADENIKTEKNVLAPTKELSLKGALNFLENHTNLNFRLLDRRFVVITPKQNSKNNSFNIQNLQEVLVTNYLTAGITKLEDGSISIKPKKLGILPGLIEPDILQTIQGLPGVLSPDETVSNITIRGGTHDQNLLLWDGIKMYQSGHFFGLISAFNPYITKRINVYKNGTRAKYRDGISSIIDMQLPNTIDNEFKASLGFNLINVDGYVKIPLSKKTELQLSTRRSVTDLIKTPTYDLYKKRIFQDSDLINQKETFYFYDITAKFLYDISKKDKIRLHFLNINNNLNYEEETSINDRNETLISKLSQRNTALGLTYIRDWNNKLSTTSQIYVSNYDLGATNFDIINNQRLIQQNEVFDGSVKLDLNYKKNKQIIFNGGYQFTEVGISNLEDVNNPFFKSYIKEVIRSHAIYAETSIFSNNAKANLKLGSRLNYISKFEFFLVEPRLRFNLKLLDHFTFEVLGEYKSQTSSQIIDLQNDFLGIEKRRWVLSNPNKELIEINGKKLHPVPLLKSKQVSMGLHYNKNKLLISVESYIKKVQGITTRSQGFQNQYQFTNSIGSFEVTGTDILINKQFSDIASTWVSYSFSMNDYSFLLLNNGEKFPNNTDIRHAATFAGTYTYKNIKFALGLNWHSGKPTTHPNNNLPPTDDTIIFEDPNSKTLGDYLRTDCSTTYAFNLSETTKATIGASVWNIFDKKNIINEYYTLDDDNNITKVENESLGITPNVSFRVYF